MTDSPLPSHAFDFTPEVSPDCRARNIAESLRALACLGLLTASTAQLLLVERPDLLDGLVRTLCAITGNEYREGLDAHHLGVATYLHDRLYAAHAPNFDDAIGDFDESELLEALTGDTTP